MNEKIAPFHYFNPDFLIEDIKIVYLPQPGQTQPEIKEYSYNYYDEVSSDVKEYIEKTWNEENLKEIEKKGTSLKNEPLVSVQFINIDNGDLDVTPIDYKAWKTTGKKRFYEQHGNSAIPNPLNVQSLIETADEKVILGPRPGKETLQVPGGMLDALNDRTGGKIDLSKAATREFHEEIAPIPIKDMQFLGTSFYAGRVLSTVFMTGKVDITADELEKYRQENSDKIKDFKDFSQIECIDAKPKEIEHALQTKKMQETAFIALLLFGCQKFGKEWFAKNVPAQILAKHLQKTR